MNAPQPPLDFTGNLPDPTAIPITTLKAPTEPPELPDDAPLWEVAWWQRWQLRHPSNPVGQ